MRAEIVAQEAGDLGEDGEQALKKTMAVNMFSQQSVSKERVEQRTKIDIFEAAFRKIKEATGVSDVNEVIQKIISQEGSSTIFRRCPPPGPEYFISSTRAFSADFFSLSASTFAWFSLVSTIRFSRSEEHTSELQSP